MCLRNLDINTNGDKENNVLGEHMNNKGMSEHELSLVQMCLGGFKREKEYMRVRLRAVLKPGTEMGTPS